MFCNWIKFDVFTMWSDIFVMFVLQVFSEPDPVVQNEKINMYVLLMCGIGVISFFTFLVQVNSIYWHLYIQVNFITYLDSGFFALLNMFRIVCSLTDIFFTRKPEGN